MLRLLFSLTLLFPYSSADSDAGMNNFSGFLLLLFGGGSKFGASATFLASSSAAEIICCVNLSKHKSQTRCWTPPIPTFLEEQELQKAPPQLR